MTHESNETAASTGTGTSVTEGPIGSDEGGDSEARGHDPVFEEPDRIVKYIGPESPFPYYYSRDLHHSRAVYKFGWPQDLRRA